ncbi:MAG: hypothetical protein JNK58_12235 [Phycisphaerae bacterium]|nr:hypothetical protein [Phycisphaerae bacterium]
MITLRPHPFPFPCYNLCPTTYYIERDPDSPDAPNEVVIIDSLTITRPGNDDRSVEVILGTNSSSGRLRGVDVIAADPWGTSGRHGYVSVIGYLDGTAGVSALGAVSGVNLLNITTQSGDVGGPVTCTMHPSAEPEEDVDTHPSSIRLRSVTGGNLTGNVTMESSPGETPVLGDIAQVDFSGGFIGRASANDPIVPVEIRADRSICDVVGKQVHAFIGGTNSESSDEDFDSFVEYIGRLRTESSNNTGLFTGEIRANHMAVDPVLLTNPEMTFEGEMQGRIWLQDFESGGSSQGISIPANKLTGTIALSAVTSGSGNIAWSGPVKVLAGPLNTPPAITMTGSTDGSGYSRLASSIGGGAVGLCPFRLHREDCTPIAGTTITDMAERPGVSGPIKMRHYGPVNWDEANGDPFKIERRRVGSTADIWTDETSCFTQVLDTTPSTNGTIVLLATDIMLQRGFEYRISRQTFLDKNDEEQNVLRSDLPQYEIADDPGVFDYAPLTFKVCGTAAEGDATDNGTVDFADITNVLANWSSAACLKYGDADRNGAVEFADITAILANFNATWCVELGQSFSVKADPRANHMDIEGEAPMSAADAMGIVANALAQMGYASPEEFSDAISHMTEAERTAEIQRLGQLLGGAE